MKVVVRIAYPNGRPIESRLFTTSPVSIGSTTSNMFRLEHPCVLPRQGTLVFREGMIEYVDYGSMVTAKVDGVPTHPGVPVRLQDLSLVEIGPYRFCVEPVRGGGAELTGEAMGGIGIVRAVADSDAESDDGATLREFLGRAVKLADAVSATIIELRERQLRMGARPFESSVLRRSWDLYEIADYLLDPSAPDSRFTELRRYLLDLAQERLPVFARHGQA